MEKLLNYWAPDYIKEDQNISNQEWKRVCIFLALVHDMGKFTPLFQSNITASLPEKKEILEKWGLEIPPQSEFYEPGRTPHGIAGEAMLRYLGCPDGVAEVVGAHHGRPLEVGQDPLDSLNFHEENFYGPEGEESSRRKRVAGHLGKMDKACFAGVRLCFTGPIARIECPGATFDFRPADYGRLDRQQYRLLPPAGTGGERGFPGIPPAVGGGLEKAFPAATVDSHDLLF